MLVLRVLIFTGPMNWFVRQQTDLWDNKVSTQSGIY
jgi:hypothetical protein